MNRPAALPFIQMLKRRIAKPNNRRRIVTSPGRAKSTCFQHHSARHSTCTHPKSDFGPPSLLRLSRSRLEIVRNGPQINAPSRRRRSDQGISRMRATCLHDMRNRAIVVIGRHPDTARIDDNNTINRDDAWDMGMPTQHEFRITRPDQPTANSLRPIEPRMARRDIFQEVLQVPSGRTAMTGEHPPIQQPRRGGKRPQPFPMVFRQARPRIGIGGTRPTCQQLAFVITCHRYGRKRHLDIPLRAGSNGPETRSPRLTIRSGFSWAISCSTASRARLFPWTSAITAILMPPAYSNHAASVHATGNVRVRVRLSLRLELARR